MNDKELDLQNKTFLDFTEDDNLVSEILAGQSRDSFLSMVKYTPALRWNTFLDFAEHRNIDQQLANKIREIAVEQLENLFDE